MVQSIFLLGVIVAPTLGPTLGGYITDNASWHWCFFINLPIGIASAFLVDDVPARRAGSGAAQRRRRLVRHRPADHRRRLAAVRARGRQHQGLVLEPAARLPGDRLGDLARPCSSGGSSRRATSIPSSSSACCATAICVASILLFVVLGFGLYGGVLIFPLFTQTILGFSPTQTGLAMMPGGLATAVMALACGRHAQRRSAAGRSAHPDPVRHGADAASRCGRWATCRRSAGEADARYALIIRGAGARPALHADQQRRVRQPEAGRGAAGIRADQSGAPARRQLRHRRARRVPDPAHRLPPRRSHHEHVSRQPGVRRALRGDRRRRSRRRACRSPTRSSARWRYSTAR